LKTILNPTPLKGVLVFVLLAAGCGAGSPKEAETPAPGSALKLRHQIMFSRGDDVQVFEGYMIIQGDQFIVKAFAGPGVDLFTVARSRGRSAQTLHIASLTDRIDIARVGEDIARVYLPGCVPSGARAKPGKKTCIFFGEPLTETYGQAGELARRRFPDAHGMGLTVTYDEYATAAESRLPRRITIEWGGSSNEMVIRLVAAETVAHFPDDAIEELLDH
jgi:hypothetical protein